MPNKFPINAKEGSTLGIIVEFVEQTTDGSTGSPITPNEGLTWSLKGKDGNVVNDRLDVALVPASSVVIVLSGKDLEIPGNYPVVRHLTVYGTYDSVLGENLELKDEVSFQIENLVGVEST